MLLVRLKVTSRKSATCLFASMIVFKLCFLNIAHMSFLSRSMFCGVSAQ